MLSWFEVVRFCSSAAVSAMAGRRVLNCLWELTYRCNARCTICAYWRHPSDPAKELTSGQIGQGLRKVWQYGCRMVNFTGGEPTLRRDLEQIVAAASGLGLWTSMVTNGSLLTRERLRDLKAAGLDHLLMSLDSTDPAYHDSHRGIRGLHSMVLERLEWLAAEFLTGHRTGGIMCALSSGNFQEASPLLDLARRFGVYAVFQPYHANKTGDASRAAPAGANGLVRLQRRDASMLNSRRYLAAWESGRRQPCSAGGKYFSIDPYGYLHPCVDTPAVGHVLRDPMDVLRGAEAVRAAEACGGCWYCFRGEADTSLSAAGLFEKAGIAAGVIRRNLLRRRRVRPCPPCPG